MAGQKTPGSKNSSNKAPTLSQLKAENAKLMAENKQLKSQVAKAKTKSAVATKHRPFRFIFSIFFFSLAVALLITGNLLFWTGNTIVKTDRFVEATAPLIQNEQVQTAIAQRTTQKLYQQVDTEALLTEALPPRAQFAAPTIASQIESNTEKVLQKTLAKPQFQTKWNDVMAKSHDRFIQAVQTNGADGAIDISEIYTSLSASLKDTKLSFLASKPLPAKVGNIAVVKGGWLSTLHRVITKIDTWKIIAEILLVGSAALAVWLSKRRRQTVILFGIFSAVAMFITLVSGRLTREVIAGKADPTYQQAVREAVQVILHPLVIQTTAIMCLFLLVSLIAWLGGPSRSAVAVKARTSDLLAGKLHQSIFGDQEPALAVWLGRNKRWVEGIILAGVAISTLTVRLTFSVLISNLLLLIIFIFAVETLAVKTTR